MCTMYSAKNLTQEKDEEKHCQEVAMNNLYSGYT